MMIQNQCSLNIISTVIWSSLYYLYSIVILSQFQEAVNLFRSVSHPGVTPMSIVDSKLVLCDIRNLRINTSMLVVLAYHINHNHIFTL